MGIVYKEQLAPIIDDVMCDRCGVSTKKNLGILEYATFFCTLGIWIK